MKICTVTYFGCQLQMTSFEKKFMAEEKKQKQLNVELPPDIAEGIYSNLAFIAHSDAEFIVDFINMLPGVKKGKVKARILLTPQHAKRLQMALLENIEKFERQHGEIKIKQNTTPLPMNFNGNIGEA